MLLSIPSQSPPHALSSVFLHSLRLRTRLSSRKPTVIASSIKKSGFGVKGKAERSVKSNAEICAEIRDFVAMAGFPEGHAPSLKDLLEHGRKDLANVVRRKGYKLITELLMNSTNEGATTRTISTTTKEASNDREVVGKDQDQKLEEYAEDSSLGGFVSSTLPPPQKASTTSIKKGHLLPLLELKGIYDQWIVVTEKPPGRELTEEELEIHYEQTLTKAINRDQNVRELIHKISYKHPFGFGCKMDLETAIKLQEMPGVIFVIPDPFAVQDVAAEKIFTVENYKGVFDSVMEDYDQRTSGANFAASVLLGIITRLYNTITVNAKFTEGG